MTTCMWCIGAVACINLVKLFLKKFQNSSIVIFIHDARPRPSSPRSAVHVQAGGRRVHRESLPPTEADQRAGAEGEHEIGQADEDSTGDLQVQTSS